MNFIRGTQFNAGATTAGGFLTLDQAQTPLLGNRLAPDPIDDGIDPDFRVRYFILGGEMQLKQNGHAYAEWRIDDSRGAQGNEGTSVFTIGLRCGFTVKGLHARH